MSTTGTRESCACHACTSACTRRPGWFRPGEAEAAAALLGVPLPELFRSRLAVDYLLASTRDGTEVGADPRGRCTFLTGDGRCEIHEAKPWECRQMLHDDSRESSIAAHIDTGRTWGAPEHQTQVAELLGRPPEDPDVLDCFGAMFDC